MEGDPAGPAGAGGLSTESWLGLLVPIVRAGIGKLKFVGGEPLLRSDLPEIIAAVRTEAPDLDISLITSGVVPVERLSGAYRAGLSRCNVTIHGFGVEAFALRRGTTAQPEGSPGILGKIAWSGTLSRGSVVQEA